MRLNISKLDNPKLKLKNGCQIFKKIKKVKQFLPWDFVKKKNECQNQKNEHKILIQW